MRLLVITPTYNERDNIEGLITAVLSQPLELDYMIVDDNSPDGTGALVDEIAAREPRLQVMHRTGKLGLGSAYRAAFQKAIDQGYDAVISMDGDWSHDPSYIPVLATAAAEADLVVGSRYLNGISVVNWELSRLVMSKFANAYVRMVTGLPFQDSTAGFQCITRNALEAIDLAAIRTDGYSFLVELKYRIHYTGLHATEVPIIFTQRRAGSSKISKAEVLRSTLTPWKMRLGLWRHHPGKPRTT